MPNMHVTITVGPTAPTIPGDAVKSAQKTINDANQLRIIAALEGTESTLDREHDDVADPKGDFEWFVADLWNRYKIMVYRTEGRAAKASVQPDDGLIT